MIANLPQGYDTPLGRWFQEGQELSIGQWQKVAIARAFMRDADLLILDEPTSSLDVQSEYDVFQAFDELTIGKMAVLISHRFSTVRMVDRIFVIEDGVVIQAGSHDELMLRAAATRNSLTCKRRHIGDDYYYLPVEGLLIWYHQLCLRRGIVR